MYFTRDPVIETVITSREGYKLSVRNTKHLSQDPFVVEAVEVISLGNTCFFRNCDHSKPFLVPAADYEVMEVRDTKINLKAVGLDRGIKIAGGREALIKLPKSAPVAVIDENASEVSEEVTEAVSPAAPQPNLRKERKERKGDKWKEKKKQGRRKSNKEISEVTGSSQEIIDAVTEELWEESQESKLSEQKKFSLLPPPAKLISEIISQAVTDPTVTSADLDESLQALVTESSEVINALLSGDQSITFPEEDSSAVEEPICEQPSPSSFASEDE
ncbi:GrgA family transcription factor [Chlamydia vaughanii]|uniref:GrgA family transcription factor n=1 Tax=Chlamydia vaughanii TaxID=3112552 RepID=UPI0032B13D26